MIKERNEKVQMLRAIAIIGVVMIHTCPGGWAGIVIHPFINYAVALFLFLSGYLTHIPVKNADAFYRKRIVRVLIPYVIWSVIYTLISGSYDKIGVNLLTTNASPILYYIFVYIQLVLITPILHKINGNKWIWGGGLQYYLS